MLASFSSTIEQLYAAAADPAQWEGALRAVEDLTGSAGAVIGFVPKEAGAGFVLSGRFDRELCEEYARELVPVCPRIAMAARRPDLPFHCDALLMSEAEMDRDPVYDWFGRRSGVRYYLGTALPDVAGYHVNTSLQRTRVQGHVQKADIELYTRLKPHLAQALKLSDIIGTLAAGRRLVLHMLESLPHGAAVLDPSGRLLFANSEAETMFKSADGLDVHHRRLTATRATDAAVLRQLVAKAAAGPLRQGGWLRVARPSGKASYVLFISPLMVEDGLLGAGDPAAVVAIFDPRRQLRLRAEPLQQVFGVSPKEAEIACLLASGKDLAGAAMQLGMSAETARTHLKSLFRKAEVNRQQDLVAVLRSLEAMGDR